MEYSKNHPSIRVHAPPGGHSNNIFGAQQDEQSAANKKKNTQSDIFGTKADNNANNSAPAKPTRAAGNNIFGGEAEESAPKGGTIAGQYKQSQMKSNIFGSDEPAATRNVSNKNQSNIFGVGDDDQTKRQGAVRQGLRVGYNPINGESYSAAPPKVNEPEKQHETPAVETPSTESVPTENSTNNESTPATETENTQPPAPVAEKGKTQSVETTNANGQKQEAAQKPVHTSVRVFHPPGGRSNGPLW